MRLAEFLRSALLSMPLAILLLACQAASPSPSPTAIGAAGTSNVPTAIDSGPSVQPEATEAATQIVTLWTAWGPAEMALLERIVNNFGESHPDIAFRVVYLPEDELRAAIEVGPDPTQRPTLFFGPSSWGPDLFEAGLLRDVADMLADPVREDVHRLAWNQVDLGDSVIGLPLELKGNVLMRNARLALDPVETVEEFVSAAEALQGQGLEGASLDFDFAYTAPQIEVCPGELSTRAGEPPLDLPVGMCWLTLLERLGATGEPAFGGDEDRELFLAGQSAWIIEASDQLLAMQAALGEQAVSVDVWPVYRQTGEDLRGYVWTENAFFPTGSDQAAFEAAYAFVIHLLSPETQALLSTTRGVRHHPVLEQLPGDEPEAARLRAALIQGVPLPRPGAYGRIRGPLSTAVRLVVSQGGDKRLALELALQELEKIPDPTATSMPTSAP